MWCRSNEITERTKGIMNPHLGDCESKILHNRRLSGRWIATLHQVMWNYLKIKSISSGRSEMQSSQQIKINTNTIRGTGSIQNQNSLLICTVIKNIHIRRSRNDDYGKTKLDWTESDDQNAGQNWNRTITNSSRWAKHTRLPWSHTVPTSGMQERLPEIPPVLILILETHLFRSAMICDVTFRSRTITRSEEKENRYIEIKCQSVRVIAKERNARKSVWIDCWRKKTHVISGWVATGRKEKEREKWEGRELREGGRDHFAVVSSIYILPLLWVVIVPRPRITRPFSLQVTYCCTGGPTTTFLDLGPAHETRVMIVMGRVHCPIRPISNKFSLLF